MTALRYDDVIEKSMWPWLLTILVLFKISYVIPHSCKVW